jgi:putative membrane protein
MDRAITWLATISLVAACDASAPPVAGSANPVAPAPSTTIATPLGPSGAPPSSAPSSAVRPPNVFTDGQMLTVLAAANHEEIEVARLVLGRSKNADVKAFAQMMIEHHGDAQKKLDALGDGPGKREAAPEAKKIEEDERAALDRFRALDEKALDAGYADAMVRDHEDVLEAITKKMIPVVAHAGLKALLVDELRPTVEKHLERAKELSGKLGTSAGAAASATPSASAPAPRPTGSPAAGASAPAEKPRK